MDKALGLSDVLQRIDVIFFVESWEHDAKGIPKIDGYLIKSICPHSKGNIEGARISRIYNERLDNYISMTIISDTYG